MHETQESVGKWALENFGKPTPLVVLRRSCDELLEAIEVCVVNNDDTRAMFRIIRMVLKSLDHHAHAPEGMARLIPLIAEELADTTIVNLHAAQGMGINLQESVDAKMKVNRKRLWDVHEDCTAQHIEEKVS